MIIDVHTPTPRHRTPPAAENASPSAMWRPDHARSTARTWDDYLAALAPVDRAIVFNIAIAAAPRQGNPDDGSLINPGRRANDDMAAFVRAHPEKLIGFLTVHPHDPHVLDEIEPGLYRVTLSGNAGQGRVRREERRHAR
jgi:hypothetical protein